jgi:hypothetical protein
MKDRLIALLRLILSDKRIQKVKDGEFSLSLDKPGSLIMFGLHMPESAFPYPIVANITRLAQTGDLVAERYKPGLEIITDHHRADVAIQALIDAVAELNGPTPFSSGLAES